MELKSIVAQMTMGLSPDRQNELLDKLSEAVRNLQDVWDEITMEAHMAQDDAFRDELHDALDRLLHEAELT